MRLDIMAGDPQTDPIVNAIARAGITGITAKQLSRVTHLPADRVAKRLGQMSSKREIIRIGRGLWVLGRFAVVGSGEETLRGPSWYDHQFEREFGVRIGRQEGEIQFNPNERRPVHRWWPYVQGFSAGFVETAFRKYGVERGSTVLDPFCGSGTVPVAARLHGAKGIGIDMMPIASFVAAAKCEWEADPDALAESARNIVRRERVSESWKPFLKETDRQFLPEVMRVLLRLRSAIWELEDGPAKTLLKLAFSSILIDSSNLKRAPCLGYSPKLGLTANTPRELFLAASARIATDLRKLRTLRESWGPSPEIIGGSSATAMIPEGSVDFAITSPPYVNGMDYVMNYKIDLAWMGFIDSYGELAKLRASMVACDNIPRATVAHFRATENGPLDTWLAFVTEQIAQNIRTKGSYRRSDMADVVRKYFGDLSPVIANVYRSLKPGGRFLVVNGDSLMAGTYIPGDMIFARFAANVGFIVEGFDVARTRRSGQRRGYLLRESVLTLRKPGPYSRPAGETLSPALEVFDPTN